MMCHDVLWCCFLYCSLYIILIHISYYLYILHHGMFAKQLSAKRRSFRWWTGDGDEHRILADCRCWICGCGMWMTDEHTGESCLWQAHSPPQKQTGDGLQAHPARPHQKPPLAHWTGDACQTSSSPCTPATQPSGQHCRQDRLCDAQRTGLSGRRTSSPAHPWTHTGLAATDEETSANASKCRTKPPLQIHSWQARCCPTVDRQIQQHPFQTTCRVACSAHNMTIWQLYSCKY